MKQASLFLLSIALCAAPATRAQDAAVEERLNKLSGHIDDLVAAQKAQQKQVADLAREIENLREQSAKPNANYASQEDLKRLAEAVKEIDRKRLDDYEKIRTELLKIGKSVSGSLAASKKSAAPQRDASTEKQENSAVPEKGIEYVVEPGNTLSHVVVACREKNIKVTVDQILKANPGLDAKKLKPGQKLFIPTP